MTYTPHGTLSPLGVASDETGQLNVAMSGATEESALSEDGKGGGFSIGRLIASCIGLITTRHT